MGNSGHWHRLRERPLLGVSGHSRWPGGERPVLVESGHWPQHEAALSSPDGTDTADIRQSKG